MKKHILVTGGAGFIGSNFCNTHKEKYDVTALDNLLLGDWDNLDEGVRKIEGDACKTENLEKVGPVDYVLHLAGSSSAPMFNEGNMANAYVNSVESFVRVLEWAQKGGAKKIMYASTSSLYANNPIPLTEDQHVTPPNHYAVTKGVYEDCSRCFCMQHSEMDIVGFRFMSVYGPNEEAKGKYANIISQFAWDISRGKAPLIFGDGTQFRDFTNVKDVVQALTLAMESDERFGAEVFNIGTGNSCTLNEITDALNAAFENPVPAEHIENPVKEVYVHGQCADISKIQNRLGYKPTVELKDGIVEQVKNLRMEKIRNTSSDEIRGK